MNEGTITLLRHGRYVIYRALEPLDWTCRLINRKRGYPSLPLRSHVGDLKEFEGSGGEYIAYLKLLCGLKPGDSLLDLGCGCGLICLDVTGSPLLDYVGEYVGWDIDEKVIDWCSKNLKRDNSRFMRVGNLTLVEDSCFDAILAKSLFTHLLKDETENYLGLIKRLLKPGGRGLATFFLLDGKELKGKYTFKYKDGDVAYQRGTRPKLAVAYSKDWLLKLLKKMELSVDVYYGTWRGNQKGLSFQDIIILRR